VSLFDLSLCSPQLRRESAKDMLNSGASKQNRAKRPPDHLLIGFGGKGRRLERLERRWPLFGMLFYEDRGPLAHTCGPIEFTHASCRNQECSPSRPPRTWEPDLSAILTAPSFSEIGFWHVFSSWLVNAPLCRSSCVLTQFNVTKIGEEELFMQK